MAWRDPQDAIQGQRDRARVASGGDAGTGFGEALALLGVLTGQPALLGAGTTLALGTSIVGAGAKLGDFYDSRGGQGAKSSYPDGDRGTGRGSDDFGNQYSPQQQLANQQQLAQQQVAPKKAVDPVEAARQRRLRALLAGRKSTILTSALEQDEGLPQSPFARFLR